MPLQAGFGAAQIEDGRIVSSDGHHVLLLAEPTFPSSNSKQSEGLVRDLLGHAQIVEQKFPGVHVAITGGHRMSVDNATLIKGDARRCLFIGMGANLGPGSRVGDFSIINTHANLEHDSSLGMFSHMAPGSVTGGHVKIGNHTLIGLGAIIKDRITVGENCVIGAGSVVIDDVPDNSMGWGNPFRIKKDCA